MDAVRKHESMSGLELVEGRCVGGLLCRLGWPAQAALDPVVEKFPVFQQSENMRPNVELRDQLMTEVKVLAAR